MPPRTQQLRRLLVAVATAAAAGACGSGEPQSGAASQAPLTGTVSIAGSSTMQPIMARIVEAFRQEHDGVRVALEPSSTSDGFNKLCANQADVADASRPINAAEAAACRSANIDYIELPIAFDSLSVVVNAGNTFIDCLTVAELKKMWEPVAQGNVQRWSDVRRGLPAQPLNLFGPGPASGTFDYFTLAVSAQGRSRTDYTASDDVAVLAEGVARDPNALGYFGYAYYRANSSKLKAISIDNGQGCIAPGIDTVTDGRYQPFSRPVFMYVNAAAARRSEVSAFADFAASPDRDDLLRELGYVPLPVVASLSASRRLASRMTGSIFGERGSVLGVTPDRISDENKVKNALVR